MLVVVYVLFLPYIVFSTFTNITDLSYFPCYYGGYSGGTCKGFALDLTNVNCDVLVYDSSRLFVFFGGDGYGKFIAEWSKNSTETHVSTDCEVAKYRNRLTKVAGDNLDYNSVVDDLKFLIGCRGETISDREKDLLDCIAPLNHTVQSCYSGVLIENGTLNSNLVQKNVSARCGWFIVYLYNDTRDAYDVKVISSHVHHTRERHGCWLQMMNLVACVCVGDNCNNNVTLLMERLMEMPFDLDRAGPMVFHNNNKFTTNQLTAEVARIYSNHVGSREEKNCQEYRTSSMGSCEMKVFYKNSSICEIVKIGKMSDTVENTLSATITCSFDGCDRTLNFRYLAYLTNPRTMPKFCTKPLVIVDLKNYVTDDGWDVYWTEPKPLKKKKKN